LERILFHTGSRVEGVERT